MKDRWRHSALNSISLKLACVVASASFVLFVLLSSAPWWSLAGASLLLAVLTYGAMYLWFVRRLHVALNTLLQIRKHRFSDAEAASVPRGDELNTLIWQVYRTGQALENEIQDLKKMENYRREFIGNVSHELKTPIFSVQGFAETLLDGALEDEAVNRSFVRKILHNVHRLNNLAQDLSDIARIETGELEMSAAPFNVEQMIREVVDSLELRAKDRGVQLHYHVAEGTPLVYGDRERIRQVLVNLADNAIKYNRNQGHVEIMARPLPTDEIKISVADNGIGIQPEHIPRLTERFYRVDKSRSRDQGGTGLGLAIVKHILGAHDRELMVESTPGSGSTFGFTLPAADVPKPASRQPA